MKSNKRISTNVSEEMRLRVATVYFFDRETDRLRRAYKKLWREGKKRAAHKLCRAAVLANARAVAEQELIKALSA